jgi:hypothetical protein
MRLDRDKSRNTTGGHSQRVPSPCEVSKSFAIGHVRLVWVPLVGNLCMVVPSSSMAMCLIVLQLLRIGRERNSLYWGRFLGWVAERVVWPWLVTLVVYREAIRIDLGGEVALSRREWASWSLYPGVCPSSLTRLWLLLRSRLRVILRAGTLLLLKLLRLLLVLRLLPLLLLPLGWLLLVLRRLGILRVVVRLLAHLRHVAARRSILARKTWSRREPILRLRWRTTRGANRSGLLLSERSVILWRWCRSGRVLILFLIVW